MKAEREREVKKEVKIRKDGKTCLVVYLFQNM